MQASGGGGGSNFCAASVGGCVIGAATGPPQVTLTYTVAALPSASIASPSSGAIYALNQMVNSGFSCSEGSGGSGLSLCADQGGRGSGSPIDTSTIGPHTFTVAAASSDGLSSTSAVTYTVAAPPMVRITYPVNGVIFSRGQSVSPTFFCGEGAGGPGLSVCVDESGNKVGAVDTSTVGTHTFTVTATSLDGQSTTITVVYRVAPLPKVSDVRVRHGIITFYLTVPGAGAVEAIATAASGRKPIVYGRSDVGATAAGPVPMIIPLSKAGKLLLRRHRRATVHLSIAYTPVHGLRQLERPLRLRVTR